MVTRDRWERGDDGKEEEEGRKPMMGNKIELAGLPGDARLYVCIA